MPRKVALAVLLAALLVGGGIYAKASAPNESYFDQIAHIWNNSSQMKTVLNVGGVEFTEADFQVEMVQVNRNLDAMAQEPRAQTQLQLMNKYGVANVALAQEIVIGTAWHYALEHNLAVSQQEAVQFANTQKQYLEQHPSPELTNIISQIGADKFWGQLAPRGYRRLLTVGKVRTAVFQGDPNVTDQQWIRWVLTQAASTTISVLDNKALAGASVEKALAYLNEYSQIR